MPGTLEVAHRAPHGARAIRPARAPDHAVAPAHRAAAHRATANLRRRTVTATAVLAALGGATLTAVLLQSSNGQASGAGTNPRVTHLDPSPVSVAMRDVTCWDGTTASRVAACGVPYGRKGLASVFPSLDKSCARTAPVVGGKVEVFTCRGSGYVVRYTRWEPGFDRFAVFSADNRGLGSEWVVGREFAGRRWVSREQTGDGQRHFKWTATYRAQPFSVEVQSTSPAGRDAGMAAVDAVSARLLGRS